MINSVFQRFGAQNVRRERGAAPKGTSIQGAMQTGIDSLTTRATVSDRALSPSQKPHHIVL